MITMQPIQLAVQVTLSADAALLAALQHLVGSPAPVPSVPATPVMPDNYLGVFSPVPMQPLAPAVPQPSVTMQQAPLPVAPVIPVATAAPQMPAQQVAQPVPVTAAAPQPFSFDALQTAAAELAASGKQTVIAQLLAEFGIAALSHLPKEQYGAFATALRGKGAKI